MGCIKFNKNNLDQYTDDAHSKGPVLNFVKISQN